MFADSLSVIFIFKDLSREQIKFQGNGLIILSKQHTIIIQFINFIITKSHPMRSLYVDDIPGAKPKRHIFDKRIFMEKHNQQIRRNARNPEEKRVFEWYVPQKRATQPLDRIDDGLFRTKRTMQKSFEFGSLGLSQSSMYPENKSSTFQKSEIKNKNILTGSGRNSLSISKMNENPYFPHRYAEPQLGQTNKWTGSRVWPEEPSHVIQLSSLKNRNYSQMK